MTAPLQMLILVDTELGIFDLYRVQSVDIESSVFKNETLGVQTPVDRLGATFTLSTEALTICNVKVIKVLEISVTFLSL